MGLVFLTVFVMLLVAYAAAREGMFTSFIMLCNVILASIVACNFFEPLADLIDDATSGSMLEGYEDFFVLVLLFAVTLGILRLLTHSLASTEFPMHQMVSRGTALVFGLLIGYIVSGFLVVAVQTMPLHENFMGFTARYEPSSRNEQFRRLMPSDRVWLAMMQRASYGSLGRNSRGEGNGFDANGNFPLRYERYRRWGDLNKKKDALPYDSMIPPDQEPRTK